MKNQYGFTMLELMVVVGIIAVVSTLAIPQLGKMYQSYKLRSDALNIVGTMRKAQVEAVQRHERTVLLFDVNNEKLTAYVETCGNAWWIDTGCGDTLIKELILDTNTDLYTNLNGNTFGFTSRSYPEGLPTTADLSGQSAENQVPCVFVRSKDNTRYLRVVIGEGGTFRVQASSNGTNWN